MDGNRNRRIVKELLVSLPPRSASASASASAAASTTPRALLRSLVRFPKYCIRKGKKGADDGREEEEKEVFAGPTAVQEEKGPPPISSLREDKAEVAVSSGRKPETVSFNLGIGVGLVFLLVKSASEFNKMIELQKQMETVLHDIKGEMQRKNVTSSYSASNNYTVISTSSFWGDESTSNPISLQNAAYHLDNGVEFDAKCMCETTLEKKRCLEINLLEEELEAELEHLQREAEGSSVLPPQQNIELESENITHSECFSTNFVEASNEPKQEVTREHGGVCPRELERRLHELLESRQQERIAELETALECAEGKLLEKEKEICWWRDTARLVSKHKEATLFR